MVPLIATLLVAPTMARVPAVPLVTHSPYVSAWSMADRLTDRWPTHWTGSTNAMLGLVRIDGKAYRWMGPNPNLPGREVPALDQTGLEITATRSIYTFRGGGIELQAEFLSPLLADDLEVLARPVTYLRLSAKAVDSQNHQVEAYTDWSGEWVVENPSSPVMASRHRMSGLETVSIRASEGKPLSRSGDWTRLDWGALFVAGGDDGWLGGHSDIRSAFLDRKPPEADDVRFPRPASDNWPVIALTANLDRPRTFAIGFDEGFAVEWLRRPLRPYWNRDERGFSTMFAQALRETESVRSRAIEIDRRVAEMLEAAGGPDYITIGNLAYRQCIAGHGLVQDVDGDLLMFSKENTSNGCIGTVDVTFPAAPFFLLFSPELLKAQVRPILEYASMPRWRFPFVPHDVGVYPLANGQVYGGGERDETNQMPVEESANMLLMVAAIGKTDPAFAKPYATLLGRWADYLRKEGFDPGEQLCTDDFTGHLAHNANLSIKAILAVRAYAEICQQIGIPNSTDAPLAKQWADAWLEKAKGGAMTRLAFDRPDTWSQKYNLFWDRYLGYALFPDSLISSELNGYSERTGKYGFPLDNRANFTKTDWLVWSASLSSSKEQFMRFMAPVAQFLRETPSRVPFTDWYDVTSGETRGMHTRTVIGGVFARALLQQSR
jgi:hypothetical protein